MLCENFDVLTWDTCCTGMHMKLPLRNFQLIPGDVFSLCSSHPIYFHPKKWYELNKCKLFVKRPALLVMDSVRPQHRPGPKPTKVVCLQLKFSGGVAPPFSSLRLFVCLFLLTTSSLFVFMICLSYSLWMTHCNQTDIESLGTLASWPWETTF